MKIQYWFRFALLHLLLGSFVCVAPAQRDTSRDGRIRIFMGEYTKAGEFWNKKKYHEAITIFEELESNPSLSDIIEHSDLLYNIACGYSLLRELHKAVDALQYAVDAGYADIQHIDGDTDLDNIRKDIRFQAICDRIRRSPVIWENSVFKTGYRPDISKTEKILGLSRVWSEVKYNFVFIDRLAEINWDSLYAAYLPMVEQTTSTAAYYQLLSKLCALLHDGHTDITPPKELQTQEYSVTGIDIWNVNDTLVVTKADDSLEIRGIVPGLRITKIQGLPVLEYAERNVYPYISSSTLQALRAAACLHNKLLAGPEGTSIEMEFCDSTGKTFSRTLNRSTSSRPPIIASMQSSNPSPMQPLAVFKGLSGNIGYVSLNSFNDPRIVEQFDSLFPQIERTAALIIDVRSNGGGNSDWGWKILTYFTDKQVTTTQWRTRQYRPTYRAWGRGEQWFNQNGYSYQPNGRRLYTKPVAVLTSPRTFSAAEDFCVAFDFMHRGTIIGERTGGSTGQPLKFNLPCGGSARVCTKHDRYPDGREFVGVGVIPTIEVRRTVKEVVSGYDKPLNVAVEYLRTQLK